MSTEEQDAEIGRLARERGELRKQKALLTRQLLDYALEIRLLSSGLQSINGEVRNVAHARKLLLDLEAKGGLAKVGEAANDLQRIIDRDQEITPVLRQSGIE